MLNADHCLVSPTVFLSGHECGCKNRPWRTYPSLFPFFLPADSSALCSNDLKMIVYEKYVENVEGSFFIQALVCEKIEFQNVGCIVTCCEFRYFCYNIFGNGRSKNVLLRDRVKALFLPFNLSSRSLRYSNYYARCARKRVRRATFSNFFFSKTERHTGKFHSAFLTCFVT